MEQIEGFIKQKRDWIDAKVKYFTDNPPTKVYTYTGDCVNYLGQRYTISLVPSSRNSVCLDGDRINVCFRSPAKPENILKNWLQQEAKTIFYERLLICYKHFVNFYPANMPQLTVRNVKSKWGSMSSRGEMTLAFNLIYLDINLIDYVISHELCHLKYQNHSRDFYQLMCQVRPQWSNERKLLKNIRII